MDATSQIIYHFIKQSSDNSINITLMINSSFTWLAVYIDVKVKAYRCNKEYLYNFSEMHKCLTFPVLKLNSEMCSVWGTNEKLDWSIKWSVVDFLCINDQLIDYFIHQRKIGSVKFKNNQLVNCRIRLLLLYCISQRKTD